MSGPRARGRNTTTGIAATTTLPAADSAWLRMDDPTNPMIVTGVMTLSERLDFTHLERCLEERFLLHDRFRYRIVESAGRLGKPRWEECPDLCVTDHVRRVQLPPPADERALQACVSEVMSTSLDESRPLWQFHYVENFAGGSALIARIHHCLGDGMALMRVLLDMTEDGNGEPLDTAMFAGGAQSMGEGSPTTSSLRRLARTGVGAAMTLGKLVTMRADPQTVFKGTLSSRKHAAWSNRIALDDVKRIGRRLGATVNDVLMSAVTGALRGYLERHDAVRDGLNVRAVVPVNLRTPEDPQQVGNKFGLVFLPLPVGIAHPGRRLSELQRRMNTIKRSVEAPVVYALLRGLGATASVLEAAVVWFLGRTATAVMTNMPGPREPLYFCGARIDDLLFWVPQAGRVSLGVSVLSYAGHVRVGIATDASLVPDPHTIIDGLHHALADLETVVRDNAARDTPTHHETRTAGGRARVG